MKTRKFLNSSQRLFVADWQPYTDCCFFMDPLIPIDTESVEFAEHYNDLPLWSAPFGLTMLQNLPIEANSRVLDVGAGTGFLTIELAQRCGVGSTVVAVDPWRQAIGELLHKAAYIGLTNIEAHSINILELKESTSSFDLIVSNLGVNNFKNRPQILEKLNKLGKPGSSFCFTSNIVGHFKEFYAAFAQTLRESRHPLDLLDQHIRHRGDLASISNELRTAGFEIVNAEVSDFDLRFVNGSAFLQHHLIRSAFLDSWKNLVPADDKNEFFQRLEHRLNALAKIPGFFTVSVPALYIEATNLSRV